MRLGSFDFSPGLWPTLATLAILPLLLGLGLWQLDRANWKQALIDTEIKTTRQTPQPLLDVIEAGGVLDFRPVLARGRYDLGRQLLLDNRIHQGRPGYQVLTPLQLAGVDQVVLVNRGWLPMGRTRADLPPLPGPGDVLPVSGTIARLPEKIFRLDAAEERVVGWPQVIQHVDFAAIEQRLGYAVLPVIMQLGEEEPHGFARDWRPVYGTSPDKHRAYAMQWFTLALVLVLIYAGVNTRRIENKAKG
jgi:surfeit locus 1 family protein